MAGAYESELQTALGLVQRASLAASALQGGIARSNKATSKEDRTGTGFGVSPVTVADFTVQVLLLGALAKAFPGDRFIAEETAEQLLGADAPTREAVVAAASRYGGVLTEAEACDALDLGLTGTADGWAGSGRTWVLDPIDGTKGFLRGDNYAIALSLLEGGRPVLGLLGCPNLAPAAARAAAAEGRAQGGSLCWAVRGRGAYSRAALPPVAAEVAEAAAAAGAGGAGAEERRLRVSGQAEAARLVRCEAVEKAHSSHGQAAAAAAALGMSTPPIRLDGQTKYAVLARGEAQVFTRLPRAGYRENIWDHAAGALLMEEAGGRVSDLNGDALDFSQGAQLGPQVTGIVASNGPLHDRLLQALNDNKDA